MIRYALESLAGLVSEVISSSHSSCSSLGRQCGPSDFAAFVPSHNRSGSQHLKDTQNSKGEDNPDQKLMQKTSLITNLTHLIFFLKTEVCCCDAWGLHISNSYEKSHQLNFHVIKSPKIHQIKQQIYY